MSTDAVAGNLFFRKGLTSGGIEELLLGATADAIEAGRHDEASVAEALTAQRGSVEIWTAAVNRLTDAATLSELVEDRRQHDGERMLSQVERVVDVVNDYHLSLRVPATSVPGKPHPAVYLEPTGRNPRHFTVAFDDLDLGVEALEACEHRSWHNPYHED